ncbi:prefoldin subunit 3 isoform X1 [Thamnophis elegans]|uniref:prefoldin subunit 3 isoform X1 n=1 Tax=Thamnophis elegans TaxID=35005 RepID=UPI0013770E9C|nr:prefoldin subunit 3 isoform X1 [Thamnophis elegans]
MRAPFLSGAVRARAAGRWKILCLSPWRLLSMGLGRPGYSVLVPGWEGPKRRSFPSAEDVDSFMKQPGNETADVVLKKLDEQYQKYKFMELNLAQKKRRLKSQIPEIKQTLEILKHMQKKKESTDLMETRFLLADNVYCKASVPPTDKVCLWLGANVMLEYDIDEAQALLEKNLNTATKNLESLEEDLDFLRDQFTTTEVNMARVYNWDVKRRNKDDPPKNMA